MHQSVMPLDLTIVVPALDAEGGRAITEAVLPSGYCGTIVVSAPASDVWMVVPRLIDEGAGAAIAVFTGGDVLAPDFLAAALACFGADGGESIAAVAVGASAEVTSRAGEDDCGELFLTELLRRPETDASCFVYRREAIERVGGWQFDLPPIAARWDLHLRLAVEWRVGLLPSRLAARSAINSRHAQSGVAAFRSMLLRRSLRQSPEQLGILLSLAQESADGRDCD